MAEGSGIPLQFQQPFDARSVQPAENFQPLPAGDYKVVIVGSEAKPTSKGDGGLLELKLQVVEGQYQNRTLRYNLNLFNPSAQAVEIAQRQLSALCHVTGVFMLQNSQQLHGIPFIAVVAIQAGGIYNDIKGVKDLAGNSPGKPGNAGVASAVPAQAPQSSFQQAAPQMFPPAAAAAAPPWATPAGAPPAPPQAWGPPQPQQPQAQPQQPWSPPAPPMQAPPAAPAWGAPQPQAPAPMPQQAAPPWAQQPQPTAAPPQAPTWPPK